MATNCAGLPVMLAFPGPHPFSRAPEDRYSDPAGSATVDIRITTV
jgi:hypothetical protein